MANGAIILSFVTFLFYFGNVTMGALGRAVWLGDVTEMLVLLGASVLFVIGILNAEARRDAEDARSR